MRVVVVIQCMHAGADAGDTNDLGRWIISLYASLILFDRY